MKYIKFIILLLISNLIIAQEESISVETRSYTTKRLSEEPKIDGLLDDSCWQSIDWQSDFTVNRPNNGEIPSRQTKFKILYDDNHLYLAFLCLDDKPEQLINRLGRRDNWPGEWVAVNIDSYGDNNTAFAFGSSLSGVKGDSFVSNNGDDWDKNWNPVWYLKTAMNDEGWTAELKIPFSQLRFGKQEEQIWGFQVLRKDFREDERSTWQHIPNNASGWVSNFGNLKGIKGIKPKRQLEIQPYIVANLQSSPAEEGNPFEDGLSNGYNFGLDGKLGLTNDITLDLTINPDFGQVEADPSALNIDGFQIFFNEQRPFFIENNNLFNFQITGSEAGGNYDIDNLFYSRRIGARPRGNIDVVDNAFVNRPNFTSILASAKVSGKTRDGWSIGVMESVTQREEAEIDIAGKRSVQTIEPLSNFFVGRLSKDFNQGATTIGGTLTSVYRDLEGTGLEDQYHSDALSGGINFIHTWNEREWAIEGSLIFSNVKGTTEKINDTQTGFEHYFQRPDAEHIELQDLTSLSGNGGNLSIANYWGEDNLSFQSGVTWRSKGLELNDIGFLNTSDEINYYFWGAYRLPTANKTFRSFQIKYNTWSRWTTGNEHLYLAFNTNARATFQNYWSLASEVNFVQKDISQKALFGGPLLRRASGFYKFIDIDSDDRKDFTASLNYGRFDAIGSDKGVVIVQMLNLRFRYQFNDAFSLQLSPRYFQQDRKIQNVSFEEIGEDARYITGRIKQKTFSTSIRMNYSITPNLTIEYWGQPFVSIGNYEEFKFMTDSTNPDFNQRFHLYNDNEISFRAEDDIYRIVENETGYAYSFDNPDFNFVEFRSNMVLRWEYKPNSELFLVWTQSNSNFSDPNQSVFATLRDDLFNEEAQNIWLVKLTYRFY